MVRLCNLRIIELQGVILTAQSSALATQSDQFTLLERIRELEQQMADSETWKAEKQKYELREFAPGIYALSLKETERGGEPAHRLCARCFEHRKKSILQKEREWDFGRLLKCHECGSELTVEDKPIYMRNPVQEPDYNPFDPP